MQELKIERHKNKKVMKYIIDNQEFIIEIEKFIINFEDFIINFQYRRSFIIKFDEIFLPFDRFYQVRPYIIAPHQVFRLTSYHLELHLSLHQSSSYFYHPQHKTQKTIALTLNL